MVLLEMGLDELCGAVGRLVGGARVGSGAELLWVVVGGLRTTVVWVGGLGRLLRG